MLQKKGKRPIGFGSIVYTTSEFTETRNKRLTDKGSKFKYTTYHCIEDGYVVVGGFKSNNGEKYLKILPIRNGAHRYISWNYLTIINSKFILESERNITKAFTNEHHLKIANDEAYRRFGKGFV